MHIGDKYVLYQLLDILIHTRLHKKLRRNILMHQHGEHVAFTFQLCILHQRPAGRMPALDTAPDEGSVFHRIGKKVLRQLRGSDDQRDAHRRKVAAQRTLQRKKRPLFYEHIRREIHRDLLAAPARGHAFQRQMAFEFGRCAFQQSFPLFRHNALSCV